MQPFLIHRNITESPQTFAVLEHFPINSQRIRIRKHLRNQEIFTCKSEERRLSQTDLALLLPTRTARRHTCNPYPTAPSSQALQEEAPYPYLWLWLLFVSGSDEDSRKPRVQPGGGLPIRSFIRLFPKSVRLPQGKGKGPLLAYVPARGEPTRDTFYMMLLLSYQHQWH